MCDFKINNPEPIVVLFGPTACGKTSLSLRLMLYLHRLGYHFNTDPFLGADYVRCWENSVIRPLDTGSLGIAVPMPPMLSRAVNHNRANKFQILDMPGEDCKCPLPTYINNIIQLPNKKIMVFVLDFTNNGRSRGDHLNLFSEIYDTALAFSLGETDFPTLFVVNKVDCMNMNAKQNLEEFINSELDNILMRRPFTTEKKLLGFPIKRKNYRVIPYSSYRCNLHSDVDGRLIPNYILSDDKFPQHLWNAIQSALSGRF